MTYLKKDYYRRETNSLSSMPVPAGGIITLEDQVNYELNETLYNPYTVRWLTSAVVSTTHALTAVSLGIHAYVYTGTGYAFEALDNGGRDTFGTVEITGVVVLAPFGTVFNIDGTPDQSVLFFNKGAIQTSGSIGIINNISYYQFFIAVTGVSQGITLNNVSLGLYANCPHLLGANAVNCDFLTEFFYFPVYSLIFRIFLIFLALRILSWIW